MGGRAEKTGLRTTDNETWAGKQGAGSAQRERSGAGSQVVTGRGGYFGFCFVRRRSVNAAELDRLRASRPALLQPLRGPNCEIDAGLVTHLRMARLAVYFAEGCLLELCDPAAACDRWRVIYEPDIASEGGSQRWMNRGAA